MTGKRGASGRKLKFVDPIEKHFQIEREDYNKLEETMEKEGFYAFSPYMLHIIDKYYKLLELKKIFEDGKIKVYSNKLTDEEREVLDEI
ncbi:MAG: hypothetical protein ACFFG0_18530 [Candidatus Thorarchaeota archaeon]